MAVIRFWIGEKRCVFNGLRASLVRRAAPRRSNPCAAGAATETKARARYVRKATRHPDTVLTIMTIQLYNTSILLYPTGSILSQRHIYTEVAMRSYALLHTLRFNAEIKTLNTYKSA